MDLTNIVTQKLANRLIKYTKAIGLLSKIKDITTATKYINRAAYLITISVKTQEIFKLILKTKNHYNKKAKCNFCLSYQNSSIAN